MQRCTPRTPSWAQSRRCESRNLARLAPSRTQIRGHGQLHRPLGMLTTSFGMQRALSGGTGLYSSYVYILSGSWHLADRDCSALSEGKVEHPGFCSGLQYRSAVFLSAIALWRWGRGIGVVVEVEGVQKDIKGAGLAVFQLHPKNTLSLSSLKTHARLTQPSTLSSSLYR